MKRRGERRRRLGRSEGWAKGCGLWGGKWERRASRRSMKSGVVADGGTREASPFPRGPRGGPTVALALTPKPKPSLADRLSAAPRSRDDFTTRTKIERECRILLSSGAYLRVTSPPLRTHPRNRADVDGCQLKTPDGRVQRPAPISKHGRCDPVSTFVRPRNHRRDATRRLPTTLRQPRRPIFKQLAAHLYSYTWLLYVSLRPSHSLSLCFCSLPRSKHARRPFFRMKGGGGSDTKPLEMKRIRRTALRSDH